MVLRRRYLISALAPASINFFKIASESALDTPSLTGLGAPSTRSLASFSPSPVTSRTALITLTLFSPNPVSTTVNSVFSSTAACRSGRRNRRRRRGHAELVFKVLDQLRQLQHRHVGNRIQNLCFCYGHFVSPESVSFR